MPDLAPTSESNQRVTLSLSLDKKAHAKDVPAGETHPQSSSSAVTPATAEAPAPAPTNSALP